MNLDRLELDSWIQIPDHGIIWNMAADRRRYLKRICSEWCLLGRSYEQPYSYRRLPCIDNVESPRIDWRILGTGIGCFLKRPDTERG